MVQPPIAPTVPTSDMVVRSRLRLWCEPITLFGEREMERKDKLRMVMGKFDQEGQLEKLMRILLEEEVVRLQDGDGDGDDGDDDDDGEIVQFPFYTEGTKSLLEARTEIVKYSIVRVAIRLERARRKRDDPDEGGDKDEDGAVNWALEQARSLVLDCSEIGDGRPLSGCSFSHDGTMLDFP